MPLLPISLPAFPDVPLALGVPPMPRLAGPLIPALAFLAADVGAIARLFIGPQWGIFFNGAPALVGDSVIGVDFRREWRLANYPVEGGGFATYDKIAQPFDVRVTFAVAGTSNLLFQLIPGSGLLNIANRTAFLTALGTMAASLSLFSVVTPELNYDNLSIVHYDYRREASSGATMIKIDVWLQEVRIAAPPQFTQTQVPAAAAVQDGGSVQPSPVLPGIPAASPGVAALVGPPPPGPGANGNVNGDYPTLPITAFQ